MNSCKFDCYISPRYDSGFFAVSTGNYYTKTHNLNMSLSYPLRYIIYFSVVSAPVLGTNIIMDITGETVGNDGFYLCIKDANNIVIKTSIGYVANAINPYSITTDGVAPISYTAFTSGYYKILLY